MTPRQKTLCREYMIDFNKPKAAIRAGYSEKTAGQVGYNTLNVPHVQAYLAELLMKKHEELELTSKDILADLVEVKNRCMQKEPVMIFDTAKKKWVQSGEWKFDSKGALKALELIGKEFGMYETKIKHSNDPENPMPSNVTFYIPDNGR